MPFHPDPMETRYGPCHVNEPNPISFAAPAASEQQSTQVTQFLLLIEDNIKDAKRKKDKARVACLTLLARTVEFCSRYLEDEKPK